MPASVVDLSPRVAAVRRLRIAVFFPRALAVTLLILLPLPISAGPAQRNVAVWFVVTAFTLLYLAWLTERGRLWALAILATAAVGIPVIALVAAIVQRDLPSAVAMLVLLVPGWLAARALPVAGLVERPSGFPDSRSSTRSWLSQLRGNARLARAGLPFATSLGCYAFGVIAGLAAGAATGHLLFGLLAFTPFALAGGRLHDRARRILAMQIQEVRAQDTRRPVLLIRSFTDDNLRLEPRFQMFLAHLRRPLTLEAFVVEQLWSLGPVVAIGKPGENLSPLGAARDYIVGSDWQTRVHGLFDECSWVAAILGDSEGLRWEYEQLAQRGIDDRLILIIPPLSPHIIVERWERFRSVFPAAGIAWEYDEQAGLPVVALFPGNRGPVVLCCRFRNETAYALAFEELHHLVLKSIS
jgi:hypothetical protein